MVMCEVLLGSSCAQMRNTCCKLAHAHEAWYNRLEMTITLGRRLYVALLFNVVSGLLFMG